MVYIVMAAVAVFCFAFCVIMLVKVEHEPEWHRPAWQDEDAEEDKKTKTISYRSNRRIRDVEDRSTPWRHDPPEDEDLPEDDDDYPADGKYSPAGKSRKAAKKPDPREEDGYWEEEEREETIYDLSEKRDVPVEEIRKASARKAAPAPKKYRKSKLLRTLETLCAIEFVITLILLLYTIFRG